jgi:hypothetical protein
VHARFLLIVLVAGVVLAGLVAATSRSDEPPISLDRLPLATGEPDCAAGQGVGTGHILWTQGSGFPTAREALAAALGTAEGQLGSAPDFTGRYVRVGGGPHATLGREFTLEGPDGELEVMALAIWQSEGGWLVSGHAQCFVPPPSEMTSDP